MADKQAPKQSMADRVSHALSVARAVPVLVANDIRRTVHNVEIGTAKTVGRAALDVREMSNPVTRAVSDGVATVAPIKSLKASGGLLAGASLPQVERAAGRAAKTVGSAAYNAADGFFKGVDKIEHAAGDKLEKVTGVRGLKDAVGKVQTALASKPKAAPQTSNAFIAKNEQQNKTDLGRKPQQAASAPGKGGVEKTSGDGGSKGTYQTIDGRAVQGTPAQQAAWTARRKTA